jgi:hypothetical protein
MWSTARDIAAGDVVIIWLASRSLTYLVQMRAEDASRPEIFFNLCSSHRAKTSIASLATIDIPTLLEFRSARRLDPVMAKGSSMFFDQRPNFGLWLCHTAHKFYILPISHSSPHG